ncbi:hypothetical protein IR150_17765 [Providencia alcalifaciens]|uniref:hypothetical protein n=1 Tax=Providencia alcalifaciens TaxID=126385 RepID=UPI0015D04845|nr:hypothetical protein [Providencia alcalifaciens]MBF0693305.1 hypothetical protein [Providencia alcalifaciens]NYS91809.1 hypothetical protein [Providencia alcalifaciens]
MKFLEEFWDAVKGNTIARVRDPIISAFIIAWLISNWKEVSLLFLGEGKSFQRIDKFSNYLSDFSYETIKSTLLLPILLTLFYLFLFPWLSFLAKKLQLKVSKLLYKQAVETEISKTDEQIELSKRKLTADPDKIYITRLVELDIADRESLSKQIEFKTVIFRKMCERSVSRASIAANEALQLKQETDAKTLKHNEEMGKIQLISLRNQAAISSERYPVAYLLTLELSEIIEDYDIALPYSFYGEIISIVFGYDSYEKLISDNRFNNNKISELSFVYYDGFSIVDQLQGVIESKNIDADIIDSHIIIESLTTMFEKLSYKLVSKDELADIIYEQTEKSRFDFLNHESLTGIMAETDTIFEEVEIYHSELSDLNDKEVLVSINGNLSGYHRNESDIKGQSISFTAIVSAPVLIGKYGLGEFQIKSVTGSVDYD